MRKNIAKSISKNVSSKYCEKVRYHAEKSAADAFETTSKKGIQETEEEL